MSVSPCGEQGKSPMIIFPRGARVGWRVRRDAFSYKNMVSYQVVQGRCEWLGVSEGMSAALVEGRAGATPGGSVRARALAGALGMAKTRPVDEGKDIEVVEQHDDQDKGKLFFAARPRPEQPAVPVLVCKHRPHSASLVNRGRAAGRRERGSACVLATSRRSSLVRYSFVAGAKVRVRRGRQNSKCHPLPP